MKQFQTSSLVVAEVENNIMAADVAVQFMISASVCRRMVDWRSLLHKINIFRRRNKQNTQPHNGVQASGE